MWWNLSLNATNQRWWVDPYLNLYECRIWQWETHLTSNFPAVGLAKVQGNVHGNGLAEVCSRPLTTGRRLIWTPLEEFKLDSQPLCVCVPAFKDRLVYKHRSTTRISQDAGWDHSSWHQTCSTRTGREHRWSIFCFPEMTPTSFANVSLSIAASRLKSWAGFGLPLCPQQ